jgi:hypothetical protein
MEMSGIHRYQSRGRGAEERRVERSKERLADPVKASAILLPFEGNV